MRARSPAAIDLLLETHVATAQGQVGDFTTILQTVEGERRGLSAAHTALPAAAVIFGIAV